MSADIGQVQRRMDEPAHSACVCNNNCSTPEVSSNTCNVLFVWSVGTGLVLEQVPRIMGVGGACVLEMQRHATITDTDTHDAIQREHATPSDRAQRRNALRQAKPCTTNARKLEHVSAIN